MKRNKDKQRYLESLDCNIPMKVSGSMEMTARPRNDQSRKSTAAVMIMALRLTILGGGGANSKTITCYQYAGSLFSKTFG